MPAALNVLILAERTENANQVAQALTSAGISIRWRHAGSEADCLAALNAPLDLILAEKTLLDFNGKGILNVLKQSQPTTPLIVVNGPDSATDAVECLKRGAMDYVPVDQLSRLGPAIAQALEARQATRTYSATEARLIGIIDSAMDAIISIDETQRIIVFNAAAELMFRCPAAAALGQPINQFIPAAVRSTHERHIHSFGTTGITSRTMHSLSTLMAVRADREEFPIEATISQIVAAGQKIYTVIIRDSTERKRAEQALQRQTAFVQMLQTIAEAANESTSLEQALQIAIEQVCIRIGWPVGHVYLASDAGQYGLRSTPIWYCADPERFATFQAITEALPCAEIDDLPGRVLISGKSEWTADITAMPAMLRARLISDIGVRAGFAFPVLVGAEVVAILEFFASEVLEPDQALLEVMSHIGTQLGRIVERTRSEEALRASEERYRLIAENTGDIMMLLDAHGRQIYDSPSCRNLLGYEPAELLGRVLFEFIHPDDQASARQWWAASESGGHSRITVRYRHADGRWRWFEVYSTQLVQQGTRYVLGVSRDVTERKVAEEGLREAETKYRTLVEQIPAIIYTAEINEHSSTRYVSPQIETILGFSPEAWLANPDLWMELLYPDDRPRVLAAVNRTRASDEAVPLEYRSFTRDGRVVWLQDAARIVRNEAGNPLFMQGITLDITERKGVEAALVEERALLARRVEERTADLSAANAELARAARLKDEFLASMSHELRTPLNAILGLSEALQEQVYGPISERQAQTLRRIEESGRHLLDLINDILDLAKIGAGKLELVLQPMPIEPICQATLRLIKQAALKKHINVHMTSDPLVSQVRVDPRRLKQILVNLLSNAVKFTPEGGAIGLEVNGDPARQLAYITVWDTGIGIAEEQISQLFQPFVQLDSRLSRQYEGTGLGLALVYRMVELHGGGIEVSSTLGAGSRFTVALPWPEGAADSEAAEPRGLPEHTAILSSHSATNQLAITSDLTRPVLLLAEDNEANIATFSDYLGAHGYQVVVARNGAEAIARAHEANPAIILMDIQMPGIDGIEATLQIRADTELPQMPIIALTALAMPGDRERCLAAGATDYVSKPVSLRELVAKIEACLHTFSAKPIEHQ